MGSPIEVKDGTSGAGTSLFPSMNARKPDSQNAGQGLLAQSEVCSNRSKLFGGKHDKT